ncbi:MAG: Multidrug/solvent efflux pump outer membrane protein MepC [Luteibacter sp.]|uniref:efflux transporter outer membrane subunit n=1 Tax=Luteibacter sp. TaxID=1886636 RepID=UPI001382CBDC|nr:TolC family protein [Luteibacter sp.]KAF1005995.1 MAG: Multidrug/solvent efflux pump outer membrane protein MepC [Luteibacter sp.]
MRYLLLAGIALGLVGCAVGPDDTRPSIPASAKGAFATSHAVDSADPVDDWWRLYRDPVLDRLIEDALAANTDVRVAVARLGRARASVREAASAERPTATLDASATYGRTSAVDTIPGNARQGRRIDLGLDVAYEVDMFGRVSRRVEAARDEAAASAADVDATRIAVVAETTRAYADAASALARLQIEQADVDLLDRSVAIMTRRADIGLTTPLEASRTAALRDQRRAEAASIEAERQAALFRLATLTGRAPADLPAIAAERSLPLVLDQSIPVGDGARLLARRPDVHAAERRLAATTSRIGVATADLYPRISLGGSLGSTGGGTGDLFGTGPLRWMLGPLITWDINRAAVRARIAEAQADQQEALAMFDRTVLRALEETETALSGYAYTLERQEALRTALDHARRAAEITRAQRREGQVDTLAALDAERTLVLAQADLALVTARVSDAQIDVFRALGGRWQAPR